MKNIIKHAKELLKAIDKNSRMFDFTGDTKKYGVSNRELLVNKQYISEELENLEHLIELYNNSDEGKTNMSDEDILREDLKKLLNGEITRIDGHMIACDVESIASEFMDIDDNIDFNGWQCDYWMTGTANGIKYDISGGAWYGNYCICVSEDKEEEE